MIGLILIFMLAQWNCTTTTEVQKAPTDTDVGIAEKIAPGAPLPTGAKYYWQYRDFDLDTFGSTKDSVYLKKPKLGYVKTKGDCNDSLNTVNPLASESANGVDDNCNGLTDEGLAGISLNTTKSLIPEFMGCGGTNEMFVVNDPTNSQFIDFIKTGNFSTWIHTEGAVSKWARWKEPFGTKGAGINAKKPANISEEQFCKLMAGDLCKTYSRDFNLSWLELCQKTEAKAIYTHNMQRGTLPELWYAIDQFPSQEVMPICYGMEGKSGEYLVLTPETYPAEFYRIMDSVVKKYPNRKFYHLADMRDIYLGTNGKYNKWVQSFINYRPIDSNKVGLSPYLHGFDAYGKLTGDPVKDSALYTKGIELYLPEIIDQIEVPFKGCPLFVAQFSTGLPSYVSGLPGNTGPKVTGRCVDMFYYLRGEKVMVERTAMGNSNFIGSSIIGLKLMFYDLDFKWLSVINNLYLTPRYYVNTTSLGPGIDILAGYADNVYSMVIQNRTGRDIQLPKYFELDGKVVSPTYNKFQGYYCTDLSSTTGSEFNPLINNTLKGFSVVYLEFNKPPK